MSLDSTSLSEKEKLAIEMAAKLFGIGFFWAYSAAILQWNSYHWYKKAYLKFLRKVRLSSTEKKKEVKNRKDQNRLSQN